MKEFQSLMIFELKLFMFFMKVGRNIKTKRNFDDFKELFGNGVIRGLSEL